LSVHSQEALLLAVTNYYASSAVKYQGSIVWDSTTIIDETYFESIYSRQEVWSLANRTLEADQYVDAHCWVFTPHSFFELLKSLIQLNLFDFVVERFYESEGCEFYVSLKAIDLAARSEGDRQALQLTSLPIVLPPEPPTATLPLLETAPLETTLLSQHIKQLQQKKARQAGKIQRLSLQLAAAQKQLEDLHHSKSWKITAPLRWLQQRTLKSLRKS
jgi:hypothetical protein